MLRSGAFPQKSRPRPQGVAKKRRDAHKKYKRRNSNGRAVVGISQYCLADRPENVLPDSWLNHNTNISSMHTCEIVIFAANWFKHKVRAKPI
jgi:hypothetical protein